MIGISGLAQNILISQGGTVNVSGGEVFYDAGGPAGNDGNTSYTITLSPATAGEAVCVDFTSFISNGNLEIFDGPNTASRNIGTLRGDYSLNYNAGGTPYRTGQTGTPGVPDVLSPGVFCSNNASGVLTFRYTGPSAYAGWVGQVITYKQASAGCTVGLTASPSTICVGGSSLLSATGVLGVPLMSNDFNTSTVGTGWSSTASVSFQSVLTCEPNYGYATSNTDNSIFVWMQNAAAPRTLETTSYDVSGGGYLSFDFREASDDNGGNGCEALDDNEGVYVQYSTDGGTSWNNLKLMFPSVESNFPSAANIGCGTYVYDWNTTTVPLPAAALSANTKFRWTQRQSTSATQDSWGLDNVRITRYATATLTITDLSTNTVIATTTTPSTSISVSPAVTTTYRATLTDGVTTCTQDITVTVNGGTATTINYAGSPFLPNAGASNVTVTNGPVSGSYSATPAGLTINTTTGQVTPSTSTPGTYTVSVPTACGTATASVVILSSTCATCATPSCPVISMTTTTAALGQTGISTNLGLAGDQFGNAPLAPGESITICVPVTVVAGSTILGFKQLTSSSPGGCGNPLEQVITYQLTDSSCGATIPPNRTNASSVASGFNPEWDGLSSGNYVLCFTMNVTSGALCSSVDIQGLGYYNVIPAAVPCQDYQIQMYSDDLLLNPITKTAFACSDAAVFLGPDTFPVTFDSGLPFNSVNIEIVANTGNLNNLVIYRYNSANVLVETLTVPAGGVSNNYFLRPTGCYYSLDKTNVASGNYTYTITDNTSGVVLATGTWIITAGAESLKTGLLFFQGTGSYSGPGVSNGFDPAPAGSVGDDYTDDRGIGVFDPQVAGVGSHTITYTWDNGLAAPNHCTLTRTMNVTVTGPSAPITTNLSICSGQTATLTASAVTGTVNWYTASSGGSSIFTGNPYTTPVLTAATSYWVSQTVGGCESTRTQVNVSITAGTPATYTSTVVNCSPGSILLSSILPTGTTFNWVSGPSGYTFPAGFQTPLTTNTSLTGLPAGTYCVDVTSPNSLGGVVTQTLFTETFESGLGNWTLDNSNGPNIFVLNNDYLGGSCVTGLGTFTVPNVPNQPAAVTSSPNSNYLHIKATTTTGATCGPGSVNFIPNNANFDGQISDQKATLNTVINTVGKSNVIFNFYWLAQGETNASGSDDFGSIEYSINGGTTWVQAGAKLRRQTTWLSDFRTDPLWDNQANLRFRVRWQNDASSSIDPPISIDQIVITADVTSIASCGTTVQECFTIFPTPVTPTITSVAASCSAAGSSTISNYSASNTYTFTPTGPTVGATGLISGMILGTSYTVTATNGGCTSVASASFSNAAQLPTPVTPTITSVAASCSAAGSSTISNYSASNTYAFTPAGPTVGVAGVISGMTVGTSYTVTATNGGCTSVASASFSNAAQLPTPAVPTITSVAASCSAAGSSTISNYSASNTYTFTPAGPTVGATGVISGMTVGTSYTVTATNGGCTSVASASFSNASQLPTPLVPTITSVAASCSAAGSSTISNYSASNTYAFTPAGPTVGVAGVISGMTVGTSYTVTATNGGCTSVASASFSNAAQLPTPAVPTITSVAASCSAAGSSTISNYSASNTYTFTPAGPTVGATGLISGMTVGTSYTVTATNGGCTSVASASFSNAAQLPTPAVPTITSVAASCSAAGSSTISNYSASNTYAFTPAGPIVGVAGVISGMTVGTSYTVTATNGGCTSLASASFSNAAQLPTPAVPTITSVAASCSAAGSSTISNYSATNTYAFTPAGPTVGATGVISGMTVGTSYTVTATYGGCTSVASASFSNAAQLPTPVTPTITSVAASCSAAGSSTISNYSATNTYAFTPAGPTVGVAGVISGMTVGTSYTVTATNGGCTSLASASFSNAAQLAAQPIPTITSVAASCSAAGSSTISNYSASNTYTFTPAGPTVGVAGVISGMTVGTSYTVTATNGGCTSVASASFSNAAQLPTPAVPTITSVAATCSAAGSSTISNYSASNTYTFTPAGPTVGVAGVISGMTVGTSYTVTATNGGCTSVASASFSNAAQLPTPAVPTITSVAASCSAAGSSTISNYSASNTYTFTPAGPTVGATGFISGMTVGTSYTVTSGNGFCTSLASIPFDNQDMGTPTITNISYSSNICSVSSTDIVLSSDIIGTTYTWSATVSNITGTYVTNGDETNINQIATLTDTENIGTITMVIIPRANGCDGTPRTIEITVNPNPVIESVSVSDTAVCSGSNVHLDIVGNISGITYTWTAITSGVTVVGGTTSGTITATSTTTEFDLQVVTSNPLVAGTIYFEVSSVRNGCIGNTLQSGIVTVNPNPGLPIPSPVKTICSEEGTDLIVDVSPLILGTELTWEVLTVVNVTGANPGTGVAPVTINDILTATTNTQGYVIYRVRSTLGDCQGGYTDYRVNVNPSPRPVLTDGNICITASGEVYQTYTLNTGLNDVDYDFEWFDSAGNIIPGATNSTLVVDEAGTYSVIATNWLTGCSSDPLLPTATAVVTETTPATTMTIVQSEYFSDNATITVTVTGGSGSIMYSLDEGSFQSSNVFTGVSAGEHLVTVIDTEGCTYMTQEVLIIDYPTYFTPNGDGINETWNIIGLNQADAKLYIFDRYGKLLKQLSTTEASNGWDGTYNDEQLPSTDYWFTLDYTENGVGKQFKAHFSLIR
ncbi:CHU large protein; uncharacterized [Flavobacteria bacterium BAL38]|nr:CHU large protein; uncharacterized [Flavobacteria bacterium BAL38]